MKLRQVSAGLHPEGAGAEPATLAMNDDGVPTRIGTGYPVGELARAFATALGHEDEATRQRAEGRLRRWRSVLRGMLDGSIAVGSRTPVEGLPAWVTPEVVRGGFATGAAAASGLLLPHETELARRTGTPARRELLFAYRLGDAGLAELTAMLQGGAYRVDVPEEAALLVVAWLVRAGDRGAALELIDVIAPFADRLRFAPIPAPAPSHDPAVVWRETAGEARAAVARRAPNPRIEAMREALLVWNPFGDELASLWQETVRDGRIGARMEPSWRARGGALLDRYAELAAAHRHCTKHRRPRENMTILRTALREAVDGRPWATRGRGLAQHALTSMIRKRGLPGTPAHAALRAEQAAVAALPPYHALARVVVARLAALREDTGTRDVVALAAPVTAEEALRYAVPAGSAVPGPIERVVRRAMAGTVEELIAAGVVPSAEILARLVPQIAATATAAAYRDDALRSVLAATYRAFRNRRSLLLLDLQHQVRLDELPWVRAVEPYRAAGDGTRGDATVALRRLGELTLDGFPGTALPNPMVRELAALSREAELALPWVEELAADIFEGTFSAKYLAAAKVAAELLRGRLYARYYGIDYPAVMGIDDVRRVGRQTATSPAFDALCLARSAGADAGAMTAGRSVAANGMVIERAQILTTHNLATLVHRVGVRPGAGWAELARRAAGTVTALAAHPERNLRPLAAAWRQMVFYLSLLTDAEQRSFAARLREEITSGRAPARRLEPAVRALAQTVDGRAADHPPLTGWTTGRHWLLPLTVSESRASG